MPWKKLTYNQHAVTARIVWPVAAVLLSMLALACFVLLWTGQRTDELAQEHQTRHLAATLDAQARVTIAALRLAAAEPETMAALQDGRAYARAEASRLGDHATVFNSVFLIEPDDKLLSGRVGDAPADEASFAAALPVLAPTLAELRDRLARATLRDGEPGAPVSGVARLVVTAEGLLFVAATPVDSTEGAFSPRVLAGTRPLPLTHLRDAVQGGGSGNLRLVGPAAAPEASLPVLDASGAVGARLTWDPERPGLLVVERVMPTLVMALLAVTLFSGFMFSHVREVTTELVAREAKATHLAHHDALSGLPNRSLFIKRLDDELAHLARGHQGLAVLFLDLDKFKEINDTFGHAAGDQLICTIASRVQSVLRGSDLLARFGGDEFAIVQTHVRTPHDCATLANRILDVVHEPVELEGTLAHVGVSIGIAIAPENGTDRDRLMHLADLALYRAKHEGRNRYSFFEIGMDQALRLRKMVEEDLRGAIERSELELQYQPQFSADGRRIVGVEALVRWNHPVHGSVSPSAFIPVAEERGLISALGEWVLRQACRSARNWKGITVAVNVSPIQFRQKDFVSTVIRILDEERVDPTRVELELTEGVIVEDADAAENAMMDLRAAGLRFALDDFGTGYSSLIYLRRFAFDKIKIDRSFLESMETTGESAILVHSIVHLGRALGLTVTAEGVETAEQQRFLQAVGCHQVQGYLFCRPVSAEKIDELLGLVGEDGTIKPRAAA
ncbi:EAL domain-containing protein [Alsobacter sp. SYSU M60028]|uniref:EAL domain-containing protein n=1 Tax=Alsobacter ponti TaxID=2962936 RepID=A0ABT1LG86_9HYPH|nr:EAL domain-containing protein [Alsobacter ponti]MCP8940459.1 EAL domain-containing protein [Alsobacter ponti]